MRRGTLSEEPDAEVIAGAVRRCEGVSRLYGGIGGEIATYLPRRQVPGVRVSERHVEVHVVGRYGPSMAAIAAEVRAAVTAAVPFFVMVDVVIEDLDVPGEEPAESARPTGPAVLRPGSPAGPEAPGSPGLAAPAVPGPPAGQGPGAGPL